VCDVGKLPLYQDDLRIISVPGPLQGPGATPAQPIVTPDTPTGVAFNGSSQFCISQGSIVNSPAKFLFATDQGVISACAERQNPDGSFDRPFNATTVLDRSAQGVQYFGLGVHEAAGLLLAADFGAKPGLHVFDGGFADVSGSDRFANPFDGDCHPFTDWLRDGSGGVIKIEGLWGLQFGNSASLGRADALHYAAGPRDETAGLFGRVTVAPIP
jgi:hypothetical protein